MTAVVQVHGVILVASKSKIHVSLCTRSYSYNKHVATKCCRGVYSDDRIFEGAHRVIYCW